MPEHEQCRAVRCGDLSMNEKTCAPVTSDGSFILGRRVCLYLRNRRVLEQLLYEGTDHGTSKTAAELFGVGQELIDSPGSGIGFLFPPAIT